MLDAKTTNKTAKSGEAILYSGACLFKTSLDREKIRETIAQGEFTTINGPIRFTGTENHVTPSMILQYQKGDLEIIWPPETATAKPIYPKPAWPKSQ